MNYRLSFTEMHSNIAFVAAGFSLRCTGETPVPPRELGKKYLIGRNSVLVAFERQRGIESPPHPLSPAREWRRRAIFLPQVAPPLAPLVKNLTF
jgi:hypothetical protein